MSDLDSVIRAQGRTFALASRLLPKEVRRAAIVLYAWYRRADDAVDLAPDRARHVAAARARSEVDALYGTTEMNDALLSETRQVIARYQIPRQYFDAFADGMEMDARRRRYRSIGELLTYCYAVAGSVGVVMAYVLGARSAAARRRAAHLGMAMQLTNICRDLSEDHANGRWYVPQELAPFTERGRSPAAAPEELRDAVRALLDQADVLYRSGDLGVSSLGMREGIAIRAARLMYAEIGARVRADLPGALSRRVVVPAWRKMVLIARAILRTRVTAPQARLAEGAVEPLRYPDDVFSG